MKKMDRREFVQKGIALSAAIAVQGKARAKTRLKKKPNLLYIFSDEHRACSLPGQPFTDAMAPNLDRFRRENFSMETCVSNYPLCAPHRAIMMTGRWPYQTGITANDLRKPGPEEISLGETFRRNGYHTGYVGKWHLGGPGHDQVFIPKGPDRLGFEDWHVWGNTAHHYTGSVTFDQNTGEKKMPQGYNATLMTDEAVRFLKEQPKDKPWMLIVSWNPPHPPFDGPPAERDLYDATKLKWRPNVNASSDPKLQHAQQGYDGHITAIDLEFARILKTLDETGQAENTIVVYTSDHGEMMGSHDLMHKRMPHEESCRVPFFVRYPGVTPSGGKSEMLFSSIDIYPTICGLAGISAPTRCMGQDFSGAMRGRKVRSPESVFLMNMDVTHEGKGDRAETRPSWRGVRTHTHTYAVTEEGRWFLYDNVKDPYQLNNLIREPSQAALIAKLDGITLDWLKTASDPFPYQSAITKICSDVTGSEACRARF